MSRSGYSDDYDESFPNAGALYGENVARAIQGKRGQTFIRDLIAALDAMPEKRLIAEKLLEDGAVCAIGSVGVARGIDMSKLNPEDPVGIGKAFGIAQAMAREIVFQNDDVEVWYGSGDETPEARWRRMRNWAAQNLKAAR